ncbi:MAG: peptidyl-prolyl cis-trans isomerase [Polyangiales bacterium]
MKRLAFALGVLWLFPATAVAQPHPVEGDDEPQDAAVLAPMRVVPLVEGNTPVASGRDVRVNAEEVYAWLRDSDPGAQRRYAGDPAVLNEVLDRLVADRLLAREALRQRLDRDPIVRAALERALVSRLRATVINPRAGDVTAVTDEETRAWFASHPDRFHIPERRRIRAVFTSDRAAAAEVLRLALQRRRGRVVNDFRRLAATRNTDPELAGARGEIRDVLPPREPGGDAVDPAVRQAVYELREEGAVVPRVIPGAWRGAQGFFVVRYMDRRAAIERTYADSAEWIRHRIVLERRVAAEREEVARLERQAEVRRVPLTGVVRLEPDATGDAGAPR